MRLILDTNRYSDMVRGLPDVLAQVSEAENVFLPFVVVAESKIGFQKGSRQLENERVLSAFLEKSGVDVLYPDAQTVDAFVDLWNYLPQKGKPIPAHDVWIAALALQHDLTLYSRDAHFDHLPQVRRA